MFCACRTTERERLLRLPEVMRLVGWRRSSIYRLIERGEFPKPVKLGARAIAWTESQICQYVESRITAGR